MSPRRMAVHSAYGGVVPATSGSVRTSYASPASVPRFRRPRRSGQEVNAEERLGRLHRSRSLERVRRKNRTNKNAPMADADFMAEALREARRSQALTSSRSAPWSYWRTRSSVAANGRDLDDSSVTGRQTIPPSWAASYVPAPEPGLRR